MSKKKNNKIKDTIRESKDLDISPELCRLENWVNGSDIEPWVMLWITDK